jgi:UPF0755 protein
MDTYSQSRSIGKIIAAIVGIIFVLVAVIAAWFAFIVFVPVNPDGPTGEVSEGIEVVVPEGAGVSGTADILEKAGVIRSAFGFTVYAALTGQSAGLQAGSYELAPSSPPNVLTVLTAGPTVVDNEVTVTLIEGWDSNEIQEALVAAGLNMGDFGRTVDDSIVEGGIAQDSVLFDGKPARSSLEGYLFPDTYTVFDDSTSQDLINRMVANLDSKLTDDMRQKIAESDMTFHEILTLASIVEKEVFKPEDRRVVAGIFMNRIEDEYLIQSDATVNFITGKNTTRPSADDLLVESAYNTYLFPGLPPGPVSNPGIDAIDAVLNAEDTDYYFFLTTPENETIYSRTLDEHNASTFEHYPE